MIELINIEDTNDGGKYFISHPHRGLFIGKFIKKKDLGYFSITLTHSGYSGKFRRIAPCTTLFHKNDVRVLKYNDQIPVE